MVGWPTPRFSIEQWRHWATLSWRISIGPGLIRTSFPSPHWIPSKCVEICGNPNFFFNSSIVQLSIFWLINRWLNIQFLVSKSPFLMLRIPWSFQSQVSLCVSILCGTQLIPDGFWPTLLVPWRGEKRSPTSCGKNELPTAWRHGRWEFGVFGVRTFLIQRSACVPTRK